MLLHCSSWKAIRLIIPPAKQLALAKNAKARVTEVKAPHLSMITAPEAVTKVILEAAQ